MPHERFTGKSGMGPRGDAIIEFDWSVGEILSTIERLNLSTNTIIIVTSDNGPVVDDGYKDQAVELLGAHKPAGPLRGGKYSAFDGGTRIPFIIKWEGEIKPGTSEALFSQVDLMASFATLTGQPVPDEGGPDSFDKLDVLLGKSKKNRDWLIEHSANGRLSIIRDNWKLIEPGPGQKINTNVNIELGNDPLPQLYDLSGDIGEKNNLATENPGIVKELTELLQSVKEIKE
jgi:arylsulfatase A-like enzyme